MSVTTFSAYTETSVTRASRNIPAMPPTTARMPTPSGTRAATTLPKTISRRTSASGSDTVSARRRSSCRTTLKPLVIARTPVACTPSESERTFARSSG
jgi:hypothetical protein